jgi:hypothetical protein
MYEEAIAEYRQTDAALPNWVVTLAAIGNVEGVAGKKREARDMLAILNALSQKKYVTPYGVALVYADLGEKGPGVQLAGQGGRRLRPLAGLDQTRSAMGLHSRRATV